VVKDHSTPAWCEFEKVFNSFFKYQTYLTSIGQKVKISACHAVWNGFDSRMDGNCSRNSVGLEYHTFNVRVMSSNLIGGTSLQTKVEIPWVVGVNGNMGNPKI
jgi:hypothetical protein